MKEINREVDFLITKLKELKDSGKLDRFNISHIFLTGSILFDLEKNNKELDVVIVIDPEIQDSSVISKNDLYISGFLNQIIHDSGFENLKKVKVHTLSNTIFENRDQLITFFNLKVQFENKKELGVTLKPNNLDFYLNRYTYEEIYKKIIQDKKIALSSMYHNVMSKYSGLYEQFNSHFFLIYNEYIKVKDINKTVNKETITKSKNLFKGMLMDFYTENILMTDNQEWLDIYNEASSIIQNIEGIEELLFTKEETETFLEMTYEYIEFNQRKKEGN